MQGRLAIAVFAFNDLVDAITNAVVDAQRKAKRQHVHLLAEYFIEDEDSKELVAKTAKIQVPP